MYQKIGDLLYCLVLSCSCPGSATAKGFSLSTHNADIATCAALLKGMGNANDDRNAFEIQPLAELLELWLCIWSNFGTRRCC